MLLIGLAFAAQTLAEDCTPVWAVWKLDTKESFAAMNVFAPDIWSYDASYSCAVASGSYNREGWLLTPPRDMQGAASAVIAFEHAHKFAGTPSDELTLWVTANYTGSVTTTKWHELPIPNYSTQSSWAFVSNTIHVPGEYIGERTVFGFCYRSTASSNAKWEIRSVRVVSACKEGEKETRPVKVCAQNVQNYYYNFAESSRPKYQDKEGLAQKTMRIVHSMLHINADVYALCEVEAKPIVLNQLTDSLNKYCGVAGRYATIQDGISKNTDSYDNALKSGFIYRTDRVKPVGSNTAASKTAYYKDVMRIQAFEEKASGGRFVVSMNHFKAKDSSADGGESTRITNVNDLLSALKSVSTDPDILVMGDLNCTVDEAPVRKLTAAGYSEQLLRFDSDAFSHCYGGQGSLIDHALANASMAAQVVNAYVAHVCTTGCGYDNYDLSYSDHEPCVVEICLRENGICKFEGVEEVTARTPDNGCRKILIGGHLFIVLPGGEMYDITGKKVQ